jgi:hypothetical protein
LVNNFLQSLLDLGPELSVGNTAEFLGLLFFRCLSSLVKNVICALLGQVRKEVPVLLCCFLAHLCASCLRQLLDSFLVCNEDLSAYLGLDFREILLLNLVHVGLPSEHDGVVSTSYKIVAEW